MPHGIVYTTMQVMKQGARMQELGRILREKRIERGLDISDVARKTRIRDYYLRAIEDDKFQAIPKAYYKGYLKIYAALLNIDACLLLTVYEQKLNPQPPVLHTIPVEPVQPTA